MSKRAKVTSIETLRLFRAALVEFADDARGALSGAMSDIQRTLGWLQGEQKSYWIREVRKRQELLTRAKSELHRKQVMNMDGRPQDTDEKKAVAKAKRRLEEGEMKLKNVQKWARLLDREYTLYRGQCQSLSRTVDGDLPMMMAKLDKMTDSLEKYIALQTPSSDVVVEGIVNDERSSDGDSGVSS